VKDVMTEQQRDMQPLFSTASCCALRVASAPTTLSIEPPGHVLICS